MNPSQYVTNAVRTEPDLASYVNNILPRTEDPRLVAVLQAAIRSAQDIDKLKRALIYGKYTGLDEILRADQCCSVSEKGMAKDLHNHLTQSDTHANLRLLHAILGLFSEAGELAEAWLQAGLDENKPLDIVNLQEELGDVSWYFAIAHDAVDLQIETTWEKNIAKLRTRYPKNFSEDAALHRDLPAERAALTDPTPLEGLRAYPGTLGGPTLDGKPFTMPPYASEDGSIERSGRYGAEIAQQTRLPSPGLYWLRHVVVRGQTALPEWTPARADDGRPLRGFSLLGLHRGETREWDLSGCEWQTMNVPDPAFAAPTPALKANHGDLWRREIGVDKMDSPS